MGNRQCADHYTVHW